MLEVEQGNGARHPEDPEPVESTKVVAALTLGVVALVLSPFVGGAIPAAVALMLARQAEADIAESGGFLLGAGKLKRIRRMAWIAIVVAAVVAVELLLLGVPSWFGSGGGPSGGAAVGPWPS